MKQMQNPFPGLRPFRERESHLFFGRENHVGEILRILESGRFVSVVGNSGSGKSSLIRAGVIPKLAAGKEWIIASMRPGNNPIAALAAVLRDSEVVDNGMSQEAAERVLRDSSRGIIQLCRSALKKGKKLLILVDQFEELFRFTDSSGDDRNDSGLFADLLTEVIGQRDLPVYIMLSLRSDFLGDCEQFPGLPEAINKGLFLIPRLNQLELKHAITGPVEYAGARISPVLVHKLVSETGNNPDQLPLLQHALMRTWDIWQKAGDVGKPLDEDCYQATGGIAEALSRHAEEAYDDLGSPERQELAARVFKALTFMGDGNRGVRRPATISQVSAITGASEEEINSVVNVFRSEDRGFIMPPYNVSLTSQTVLDISHESLMRVWDRLKNWVDEEAESAELYRALANSAMQYERNKSGLWRDPDLQQALDWKEKNQPGRAWAEQYHPGFSQAMRFLNASEQHRQHLKRLASLNRKLVVGAMLFAIVALSSLSLWAFTERQNSQKSEKAAVTEKLKAETQKQIAEQQKSRAEENLLRANSEEKKALAQQAEAERQKNLAILRAEETKLQKLKAERATVEAVDARRAAELDRKIAESQKLISDSLRVKAERSEKNALRLRILSLAQNIAINSRIRASGDTLDQITLLLAVQAYKFHHRYRGEPADPVVYDALFQAMSKEKDLSGFYKRKQHGDAVKCVLAGPGESEFISGGDDGVIIFHHLNQPDKLRRVSNEGLIISNLCFSPDKTKISWSGDNNRIYILNVTGNTAPVMLSAAHEGKITSICWTESGIVSTAVDNVVRLTDPDKNILKSSLKLPYKPTTSVYNKQKNNIFIGCDNGNIYIVNSLLTGNAELFSENRHGSITSIDINSGGTALYFGTSEGICVGQNTSGPGNGELYFSGHSAGITSVKCNPVNGQVASAGLDGKVVLWNTDNPESSPIITGNHESWIYGLNYFKGGNILLSCGKDKSVQILPASSAGIYDILVPKLKRNFTETEWKKFIGQDIPYESTMDR